MSPGTSTNVVIRTAGEADLFEEKKKMSSVTLVCGLFAVCSVTSMFVVVFGASVVAPIVTGSGGTTENGVGSVLSYELYLCGMVDEVQVWVGPNQDCSTVNAPPYLSAKAFRDIATVVWNYPFVHYGEQTQPRNIPMSTKPVVIYSQTSPQSGPEIAAFRRQPFVLISGSSDYPASMMKAVLQNPMLVHWFAENVDDAVDSPKLTPIPIGINGFVQRRPMQLYLDSVAAAESQDPKPKSKMLLINFRMTHGSRETVHRHFCENVDAPDWATCISTGTKTIPNGESGANDHLVDFYRQMAEFKYMLCPRGNGVDTHRIYEALSVGVVPIIQLGSSRPMDRLYKTLPALLVHDFEADVTLQRLKDEYEGISAQVMHWKLTDAFARFRDRILIAANGTREIAQQQRRDTIHP